PMSARSSLSSKLEPNELRAHGSPSRVTPRSSSQVASPAGSIIPRYIVLEVTSHALDQNRVFGIEFDIGVLTNITSEHLDYHKTYEEYARTKLKLLQMAKVAVVNRDEKSYSVIEKIKNKISKRHIKNKKWITYGLRKSADITPQKSSFKTNLIGEFNKYNVLAAISVCKELGLTDQAIRSAIASFEAPTGRGEIVHEDDFMVMIDFAHTPNALEQLLSSTRSQVKGKIIHVFGSAGERDRQKRPKMGQASSKYADIIILTAEDPRSESVEKIIREIKSGIKNHELRIKNNTLFKIPDRQEAIKKAISMAKKGDLVLLTGKGHEQSINYGHGEEPWSEHEAVKAALKANNA
ncbi:MAG: UDP-N-acetylmuramyl-tripeptide synthetase, partial [Candidatus Levybacteria bacterium]|nr:UDP-N-acetylmuramyl-tripeptide synthetase [Candidatus Levybacteria bacterium]